MAKRKTSDDLKDVIEKLQKQGYKVKKPAVYVKKTFDVDAGLLQEITETRLKLDMSLRECVAEALELWLDKHSNK